MVQFVFDNWHTILFVYGIIALMVFIAMLWFWVWVIRAEKKEAYKYPDEYVETGGIGIGIVIALVTSVGCAFLWIAIPVVVLGLLFYDWIVKTFPDLMELYYIDEEEERDND